MPRDWTFYLEDIHISAQKVLRYTSGLSFDEFENNEQVVDATIRNLEIIGEAAKHLPDSAKALMPHIEWSKAAAFRDVISHQYFGLDLRIVWDVIKNKIPEIEKAAGELLKRQRENS